MSMIEYVLVTIIKRLELYLNSRMNKSSYYSYNLSNIMLTNDWGYSYIHHFQKIQRQKSPSEGVFSWKLMIVWRYSLYYYYLNTPSKYEMDLYPSHYFVRFENWNFAVVKWDCWGNQYSLLSTRERPKEI